MKTPRLIDPEEVERFEEKNDRLTAALVFLLLIISIGIVFLEPDVEAIGHWIWKTFM